MAWSKIVSKFNEITDRSLSNREAPFQNSHKSRKYVEII